MNNTNNETFYRVRQHGECFYAQFACPKNLPIVEADWKYIDRGTPHDSLEKARKVIESQLDLPVIIHPYP